MFENFSFVSWACQISLGKSRRMRWAGHVARMGEERSVQGFGGKARRKKTTWKTKA
jgi:hypothetical protein